MREELQQGQKNKALHRNDSKAGDDITALENFSEKL
jgi:hypothetical protein